MITTNFERYGELCKAPPIRYWAFGNVGDDGKQWFEAEIYYDPALMPGGSRFEPVRITVTGNSIEELEARLAAAGKALEEEHNKENTNDG